jgi:hypothetical protein
MSFHLLGLERGDEVELLDRAVEAVDDVEPGESVFLPEYLAWTAEGSGRAFARLAALARERNLNLITTLNLAGDLVEDLPGQEPNHRYNAVVLFTRHGVAHVPQAKTAPQSYERIREPDGPGIGVDPYPRLNRVTLDLDDQLVHARFLVSSDLRLLYRLSPRELACDLLVVLGGFVNGADKHALRLISRALQAGVASTAIFVNGFERGPGRAPLAVQVEEVLDAVRPRRPKPHWASLRAIHGAFHLYNDGAARDFAALRRLRGREGKIPLPRSAWELPVETGSYPVTVVL